MVIAREDRPGDKRLVGYITGDADPAEARAALAQRLPAHMVPAAVVLLASLPVTVNGKLDTRALPAPEYAAGEYRAPASAVEEILAGIYGQVLGLTQVGVDDSFFDLGGDSISAMRLIAAVNTRLDADLSVRAVFEAPTVAELAPRIGEGAGGFEPLVAGPRPAVVPLSFAQSRLWFLDQLQGPSPVYNMAAALRLSGSLRSRRVGCGAGRCRGAPRDPADGLRRARGNSAAGGNPGGAGRRRPADRRCRRLVGTTNWMRPSGPPPATRSTWPPKYLCEQRFSASPTTSTYWSPWCTTSRPTAGRCGR